MFRINENFLKFSGAYLFTEVARRRKVFLPRLSAHARLSFSETAHHPAGFRALWGEFN